MRCVSWGRQALFGTSRRRPKVLLNELLFQRERVDFYLVFKKKKRFYLFIFFFKFFKILFIYLRE